MRANEKTKNQVIKMSNYEYEEFCQKLTSEQKDVFDAIRLFHSVFTSI